MFKGYNLELLRNEAQGFFNVSDEQIAMLDVENEVLKDSIQKNLNGNVMLQKNKDNHIDGSKLINDWFPNYKADVFISHSHNDARTAKRLAVWLSETFELTSFIDSIIWGSANDLLKKIDEQYSVLRKNGDNTTYNYDIRNYTTSHVHMMLSTAISDIIHSTECVIFLNTPESLSVNEAKEKKTNSPWIYSELKVASIVEKIYPRKQLVQEKRSLAVYNDIQKDLDITYSVTNQLAKFENLNAEMLEDWSARYLNNKNILHPLDLLYFDTAKNKGAS
ncbi:hypothetical protein IBB80_02800 [Listeria marthii]|uniref:hypothetical protein n=1 Tax=Listeria marthii TaxID=529731 RepID=UPI0018870C7B|nr:hypothetical protein [Listeria marthii]MBF2674186.1 hypothetical protein [Listeria marthii]